MMPSFYGLEKAIKSYLETIGYEVQIIENKIIPFDYKSSTSKFKLLRKFYFLIFGPGRAYIRSKLKELGNTKFDVLFAVNCHAVNSYLFRKLRKESPKLYTVLYLWDSLERYTWHDSLSLFDKVITFDKADSEKYKLAYLPNFYILPPKRGESVEHNVIFFSGKLSLDRYLAIEKIENQIVGEANINTRFILWPSRKSSVHNKFFYFLIRMFKFECTWAKEFKLVFEAFEGLLKKKFLIDSPLDFETNQVFVNSSNVILDLPVRNQTGYTHRLIEALALGKKIITTNKQLSQESFFDSAQIKIIDPDNPIIDLIWVKKWQTFPVSGYINDLEIRNWLKLVLSEVYK